MLRTLLLDATNPHNAANGLSIGFIENRLDYVRLFSIFSVGVFMTLRFTTSSTSISSTTKHLQTVERDREIECVTCLSTFIISRIHIDLSVWLSKQLQLAQIINTMIFHIVHNIRKKRAFNFRLCVWYFITFFI